jgi:hypothetical protein
MDIRMASTETNQFLSTAGAEYDVRSGCGYLVVRGGKFVVRDLATKPLLSGYVALQSAVDTVRDWKCPLIQNGAQNRRLRSFEFL